MPQFEVHPRRPESHLRQVCAAADVAVVAYASLGCGELLNNTTVKQVAAKTGKTEAQVGGELAAHVAWLVPACVCHSEQAASSALLTVR